MTQTKIFDRETPLPDTELAKRSRTLLGFDQRYERVKNQLRLLLSLGELGRWNAAHHNGALAIVPLMTEQYPFAIFYGDVGTGKTAMAECIANQLVSEARVEDSVLFKLSNRVRGGGKVGEMGTLLADAFLKVQHAAGKHRRAILIIDEGDSLGAARSQEHSHHEDKVAVNTLIQGIDDFRQYQGRIVVILCTNRISVLDPALHRRAAIVEEFKRPTSDERRALLEMDLGALRLSDRQIADLVSLTGSTDTTPSWTYSDIRTRLYPGALALAFPLGPLKYDHLRSVALSLAPSPAVEDR